MMMWTGLVLFVVAVAAVVVVVPLAYVVALRRRREIRRLAQSLGFTLVHGFFRPAEVDRVRPFHEASSVNHVIEGDYRGRHLLAYDAGPPEGTIRSRSRRRGWLGDRGKTSICLLRLDASFPDVAIRPREVLSLSSDADRRIAANEVRFESDEFNRAFKVLCDDARFAYALCHPRAMEWLLERRSWHLAFIGGLLALKDGNEWAPDEFVKAFDMGVEFIEMIPGYLWDDYSQPAASLEGSPP